MANEIIGTVHGVDDVRIDPTLTVAGQAADARATGEAIAKASTKIGENVEIKTEEICFGFPVFMKTICVDNFDGEYPLDIQNLQHIVAYGGTLRSDDGAIIPIPSASAGNNSADLYVDGDGKIFIEGNTSGDLAFWIKYTKV